MLKILLDSSFIISAAKYKVDFYNELVGNELFVFDKVVEELKKLINSKKPGKREAVVGLGLLRRNKVKVIKTKEKGNVDDLIVESRGYIVATQDKELKKRLKDKKIITIRQRKILYGL